MLSRSPSAATIAPNPVAVLTQSAQDLASPRSQPNRELTQMPTMAPARRRQSIIFTVRHRNVPLQDTHHRDVTLSPLVACLATKQHYQGCSLQQHHTSPARPMLSASIQDTSARPAVPPSSHSIGSPQHHGSQQGHGTQ
jgi:hypothetical protein